MKINGKQSGSKRSAFWVEAGSRGFAQGSWASPLSSATFHLEVAVRRNMRPQRMNVVTAGASAQSEENVVREKKIQKKKILFTLDRTKICIEFYYAPL